MAIFAEWSQGQQALTGSEANWFTPLMTSTSDGDLVVDPYTTNYNGGTSPWNVTLTTSLVNYSGQLVSSAVPIASYATGYNFHIASVALANGDIALFYDQANAGNPSTGVDIEVQLLNASGQAVGSAQTLETDLVNVQQFQVGALASGGTSYDLTWATSTGQGGTETVDSQVFTEGGQASGGVNQIDSFTVANSNGIGYGFGTIVPSTQSDPSYIYLRASNFGQGGPGLGLRYELVGVNGTATTSLSSIEPNYPSSSTANALVSWNWARLPAANSGEGDLAVVIRYTYVVGGVTSEALDVRTINAASGAVASDVTIPAPTSSSGDGFTVLSNGDFVLGFGSSLGPTIQAFDAAGQTVGPAFALPSSETHFNMDALTDNRLLIEYPSSTSGGNQLNYDVFTAGDLTAPNDLNNDGLSDLVWRNTSTGATETWFSSASGGYTYADDGTVSLNWQIAGTGDFNGDGPADILWRNAATDDTYLYLSNGSGGFTYSDLGIVGGGWQVAGLGVFTSNGLTDIAWRNTATGDDELWLSKPGGGFNFIDTGPVSTSWQVVATGDLNGDGLTDLLWRNTSTGDTETYFSDGAGGYIYGDDGAPGLQWQIAGTGDFNGDGDADILWRNTSSGDAYLYLSNGSGGFGFQDLGVVSTDWQIAEVGDFTGNGVSDILWRNNATGEDELWLTKAGGGFSYSNIGQVPTNWKIAA